MTDWSIWPATNGPNTDVADPTDISRGVIFQLSAPGWLTAIRFYRGTVNVGNHTGGAPIGRLYAVAGETPVVGTDVTFTLSGTGWQTATLAIPVLLSAGVRYKAVVLTGNYTATGGYFASGAGVGGIVNGILTAPDAGGNPLGIGGIQQGSYRQPTVGLQYPNQYFGGGNYWVDVIVADEDPGSDVRDASGAAVLTSLTVLGTPSKVSNLSGSVNVGVNLTASLTKAANLTASIPVGVALTATPSKLVSQSATLPIGVTVTGTAEAVGAGTIAPVSEVLCSSWANFLDVPQRMKDKLDLTEAEWQNNLMRASELLWMLSGRRWLGGGCTETATLRSWPPMNGSGQWPYDPSWGTCGCWHDTWANLPDMPYRHTPGPMAIQLPRAPITNIVSMTVDGEAFTEYAMLRTGWVERTDGQAWGVCGDVTTITYQFGEAPPAGGKQAAIDLAFELGREQIGDGDCRLPGTVTSITRQQVTITRQTADDYQRLYRTGLPEVDRWLVAVNPQGKPSRARVWSPDIPSAIRTPQ